MHYLALLLLLLPLHGQGAQPLRVAVAANFRATLEQVNTLFQQQSGYRVVLSSASTGVLYSQILHGAPFDIFFAADKTTAIRLARDAGGPAPGAAFCYATGSLVLAGGDGKLTQLDDPAKSLAIANPVTAPYGAAALEVLRRAEFGRGEGRKLVRGTNVLQAYQFWHSGATDLALIPRALAPSATPIPAAWHQPLEQFAIALAAPASHPALASYLEWIASATVRTLITDAGYQPCL